MSTQKNDSGAKIISSTQASRLREIRGEKSLREFAEELRVSYSVLAKIETGDRPVTRNLTEKLLEALPSLSMDWLLTGRGDMFSSPSAPTKPISPAREALAKIAAHKKTTTTQCHILSDITIGAGYSYYPGSNYPSEIIPLPCPPFRRGHTYHLVKVSGDSMDPPVHDGDSILVDISARDPAQCLRRLVVANVAQAHDTSATLKILVKSHGRYSLIATNPAYPPIHIEPWQIVGLAIPIPPGADIKNSINTANVLTPPPKEPDE